MSIFTPDSKSDVAPIQLDLFTCPPSQVAVLKQYYETVRPLSQYHGLNPLLFQATLQGDTYTDLSRSKLFLKCRLLKADGSHFSDEADVFPVNLLFQALWSDIDVKMNETLVYSSGNMYPYIAYFHTLLRTNTEHRTSYLSEQMYAEDTPGFFDSTSQAGGNYGAFRRHSMTKGSSVFELAGPILSDCMLLDRYLLNGVKLDINMKRSSPKFCLMSSEDMGIGADNYRIEIEEAFLRLHKVRLNPAILIAHSKLLKSVTAKYPYIKRNIRCCSVPPNQSIFNWNHIAESPLPKFVLIAFCSNLAVAGSYKKSPWNFTNCDVKQLSLCVNGISVPGDPVDVNYSSDVPDGAQVLQVYDRFFDATNNIDIGINRRDVGKGFSLYLFHLDPDYSENIQFPLLKTGEVSVNARFGSPLTDGATCIAYTEKYGLLEFDETRNVKIN